MEDRSDPARPVVRTLSQSSAGERGEGFSFSPQITGDGRLVYFISTASNLPGASARQGALYAYDTESETLAVVDLPPSLDIGEGKWIVSEDGRYGATNFSPMMDAIKRTRKEILK